MNPVQPKLLMITGLGSIEDLVSGKKGAFYNTLEEFHKYWERIDIISPKVRGQESGVKTYFGNVYVHISSWPLLFHPIWFIKKGMEIYREQKFDLMTVQEFPPFYNGIGARLLWRKIRVPYILEIHHIVGYPRAANLKEWIYRAMFRLFIKFDSARAKAIRVVNQNQAVGYLKKCGIPEHKIKYIPSLYIDFDIFKPINVQKEYDLIFVGRLESNKGIDLFLETVKQLGAKAIIVGNGSLLNKIKLKIENRKLRIDVRGWAKDQKEIAELINKSKLLVMPSYNEGGPRVVFESLACGTPVLATPVGLVPDFKSSITTVDWNSKDIATKAKKLLSDKQAYDAIRIQGLSVAKQFEKKEMIKNYAEKLKTLV